MAELPAGLDAVGVMVAELAYGLAAVAADEHTEGLGLRSHLWVCTDDPDDADPTIDLTDGPVDPDELMLSLHVSRIGSFDNDARNILPGTRWLTAVGAAAVQRCDPPQAAAWECVVALRDGTAVAATVTDAGAPVEIKEITGDQSPLLFALRRALGMPSGATVRITADHAASRVGVAAVLRLASTRPPPTTDRSHLEQVAGPTLRSFGEFSWTAQDLLVTAALCSERHLVVGDRNGLAGSLVRAVREPDTPWTEAHDACCRELASHLETLDSDGQELLTSLLDELLWMDAPLFARWVDETYPSADELIRETGQLVDEGTISPPVAQLLYAALEGWW